VITAVSLLRGVNVGGHHKVKMDALRAMHESMGHRDVRTYIQSGNVVFRCAVKDMKRLAGAIGDAIEKTFGFRCDVIVRTAEDMRAAVENNPFAGRTDVDPGKLAVTFLPFAPPAEARAKLAALMIAAEEVHLVGSEMYIYFPTGMGQTKFPFAQVAKALGAAGTARNWNTVHKLVEMANQ
jgi:uncharacterized protein (DUF1697 family)